MTPAEIREAVARLVEAGKRFGDGSLFIDNAPHMDTILAARVGAREIRVQQRRPFGNVRQDNGLAHFLMYAANARPALAALAGMCVLPAEVVRVLAELAAWSAKVSAGGPTDDERAAIAAAEAELRRVEVRDV